MSLDIERHVENLNPGGWKKNAYLLAEVSYQLWNLSGGLNFVFVNEFLILTIIIYFVT